MLLSVNYDAPRPYPSKTQAYVWLQRKSWGKTKLSVDKSSK